MTVNDPVRTSVKEVCIYLLFAEVPAPAPEIPGTLLSPASLIHHQWISGALHTVVRPFGL